MNETFAQTVTTLGTTFASGTAYVSFESLVAYDRCDTMVGTRLDNFYMPLESSEVSTQCGEYGLIDIGPQPTAINWADLDSPIPLSAYTCQEKMSLRLLPRRHRVVSDYLGRLCTGLGLSDSRDWLAVRVAVLLVQQHATIQRHSV